MGSSMNQVTLYGYIPLFFPRESLGSSIVPGPFRVVKRLSAVTYRILDLRRIAARRRKRMVVHLNHLKPCPSDIHLDFDDVEAKNPEAEGPTSTNQSRHRPE